MKIKNFKIGDNHPPFIIAEFSANHMNNKKNFLRMIDYAKKAKVSAIKLQTYDADSMTVNVKLKNFMINDKKSIWYKNHLYDLYKKGSTPFEWHKEIFEYSKKKNLICFSTPFDEESVDKLESLNAPCYKIASFECTDLSLIKKVSKTKKPVIISTGMATLDEISEAADCARSNGCKNLALLKCVSVYPAKHDDLNLSSIKSLKKIFNCEVGFSDHTIGIGASVAAVALGANIIEKHFTLSKKNSGLDSKFSSDPEELSQLVKEANNAKKAIGKVFFGPVKLEIKARLRRRSIYCIKDIKKGEKFSIKNIKRIRPGYGLEPKYFMSLIGKKATKDIKKGHPITALNSNLIKSIVN